MAALGFGSRGGSTVIRKRKYLFVDGASFEQSISSRCAPYINNDILYDCINLNWLSQFDRTFYYDSLPDKGASEIELPDRLRKERFFDVIRRTNNCHVHTGFLRHRKKKNNEQKGVDVLLTLQMMQHAYQGNMDEAHLLSSDLDFFPVLDALTQTRVSSVLIYDPRKTSDDLIFSADIAQPINYRKIHEWLKSPHCRIFAHDIFNKHSSKFGRAQSILHDDSNKIHVAADEIQIYQDSAANLFYAMLENDENIIEGGSPEIIVEILKERSVS